MRANILTHDITLKIHKRWVFFHVHASLQKHNFLFCNRGKLKMERKQRGVIFLLTSDNEFSSSSTNAMPFEMCGVEIAAAALKIIAAACPAERLCSMPFIRLVLVV